MRQDRYTDDSTYPPYSPVCPQSCPQGYLQPGGGCGMLGPLEDEPAGAVRRVETAEPQQARSAVELMCHLRDPELRGLYAPFIVELGRQGARGCCGG